jgi:ABC-type multidrug transport system fused ATPase/permease subunit
MGFGQATALLWRLTRSHVRRLWLVVGMAVVGNASLASEPLVMAKLFDGIRGSRGMGFVILCLSAWLGLALVGAFAVRLRDRQAAQVAAGVSRDVRRDLAERRLRAIAPTETFEVILTNGGQAITSMLGTVLPSVLGALIGIATATACALSLDWRVAIVVAAAIGPVAWLNNRLAARLGQATTAYAQVISRLAAQVGRHFHSDAREHVAAMSARPMVMAETESVLTDLHHAERRRLVACNFYPATKSMGAVLGIAVVGFAAWLPGLSLGALVGFVALARTQIDQMLALVGWMGAFADEVPHLQRTQEALRAPTERSGGTRPERPASRLELRAVTAGYADGRTGLQELSVSVGCGDAVALVGESGSGKTTLLRVLGGDPSLAVRDGLVTLDGVSTSILELDFLRRSVLHVLQRSWVPDGTVRASLLPPPGTTDAEIEWACRLVGVHDQIVRWPGGYATDIHSTAISGGQRQRLSIARALLRTLSGDVRIMLFDEATSALDPESAGQLLDRVLSYLSEAGIGAVVSTHKLPLHPRLTRVLVLHDGRVVEDGDPRELATAAHSRYARMLAASSG